MTLNREVVCWDWIEAEKHSFTSSRFYGGLLKIKNNGHNIEVMTGKDDWPLTEPGLYMSMIRTGDDVVLIPLRADRLAVYSMKERKCTYYPVPEVKDEGALRYTPNEKFVYGHAFDDRILIFPSTYPAFILFNNKSKKMTLYSDWTKQISGKVGKRDFKYYLGDGFSIVNRKLYFAMFCCSKILMVDIDDMEFDLISLNCGMDGYEGISHENSSYYLTAWKGKKHYLVVWNPYRKEVNTIRIPFNYSRGSDDWVSFLRPLVFGNRVYLLPYSADHCYSVDFEAGQIRVEYDLDRILGAESGYEGKLHMLNYKLRGKRLIFQSEWDRRWHEYDLTTGEDKSYQLLLTDEAYWKQYELEKCGKALGRKGMVMESDYSLETYFKYINC